ncbi:MAG: C40 family peptidase [Gemmatimonadaceae bacterium]
MLARPARAQKSAAHQSTSVVHVRGLVYGEDLVRSARRFLGQPYVWGGDEPGAFDCSGFVRYVFAQHQIALPRTAHEQATIGDAPYPGDLKPGDLLFFWGGRGAQHIAIYIGGDTIIHASSRGGRVKLDHFSGSPSEATWFGQRLIAVRRILPADGVLNVPMTASRERRD